MPNLLHATDSHAPLAAVLLCVGCATITAQQQLEWLFGGRTGPGLLLGDTWEWDGSNWLQRQPSIAPPARANPGMAYDPLRARTDLFGGGDYANATPSQNDHWQWDGTNWLAMPAAPPTPRANPLMQFDPARGTTLLLGGYDILAIFFPFIQSDDWEWNGVSWSPLTQPPVRPAARRDVNATFDHELRRTVLFGGDSRADIWWLGAPSQTVAVEYGAGCSGTFGTPSLHAQGFALPAAGRRAAQRSGPGRHGLLASLPRGWHCRPTRGVVGEPETHGAVPDSTAAQPPEELQPCRWPARNRCPGHSLHSEPTTTCSPFELCNPVIVCAPFSSTCNTWR